MRLRFLFFAAALCNSTAFGAQPAEVYYQGDLTPLNVTPTFDKGYLFVYDARKIDVYAPDGSLVSHVSAQVPSAQFVHIDNAAADTDGTVAGAVEYFRDGTTRRAGGGIALFDQAGKQIRFFDTGRYLPTQVCFAPDHSIWTLGWQGVEARDEKGDYFILRNYSQDGQEMGAFLPRSSFEPDPDPIGPMVGRWQLRIANDRIGALFYGSSTLGPQQQSRPMQWIEVDLTGRVLGRWELGAELMPWAFTQSGALYTQDGNEVLMFDRSTNAWRPSAVKPAGTLLGADGDSLVFEVRGTSTLRWVSASR